MPIAGTSETPCRAAETKSFGSDRGPISDFIRDREGTRAAGRRGGFATLPRVSSEGRTYNIAYQSVPRVAGTPGVTEYVEVRC